MKSINQKKLSWINRLHAGHKLLISFCIGCLVYFLVPEKNITSRLRVMLGWDTLSLTMIILSCITFFTITSQQIRDQCKKQDETRVGIFLLVLISTLVSLAAVLLLFKSEAPHKLILPVTISGMALSWILVHTIFTFRYAHLFYGNDENDKTTHAGGLEFPEDKKPDYLDFAYFSFVLGMTFQVSDVQISSKRLRRLCLLHGLISFAFNTFIVALTINIIASLIQNK